MCGICGYLSFNSAPPDPSVLKRMTDSLVHRGPDDEGFYFTGRESARGGTIGLGFRRLSIIDLAGGHQPMQYKSKVIAFNGEIYNFRELKTECESLGHRFKTRSDTEVLLHLFDQFGETALKKLNGMFALALWDEDTKELLLARDRCGIKPLYTYHQNGKFLFASEIKSLFLSDEIPFDMDPVAVTDFFTYRFVPGPYSILKNVRKVLPGGLMRVKNGKVTESSYWSPDPGNHSNPKESFTELKDQLSSLLSESVRSQMVSDVPLGAFLSGGVDSSLITAWMVRHSAKKVQTFSIGFEKGTGVDESVQARRVAQFLGTEHHELFLTEKDLYHTEKIFSTMNEPVADPTVLPTSILSEFARKSVKVVLTGEGGDELFAGYNRYKSLVYSDWVQKVPLPLRAAAGAIFRRSGKGSCFQAIPQVDSRNWFGLNQDFQREKLKAIFRMSESYDWKSYLDPERYPSYQEFSSSGSLNPVLELERRTALVDRLLMKVDMASMAHSLEARPPYLDHKIVEFAARLPAKHKIKYFKGKYILRAAARNLLPPSVCWRKKHGFIVPIWKWVASHPREWLDNVIRDPVLDSVNFFDRKSIQNRAKKIYNREFVEETALLWPYIVLSLWAKSLKNTIKVNH